MLTDLFKEKFRIHRNVYIGIFEIDYLLENDKGEKIIVELDGINHYITNFYKKGKYFKL